MGRKLLLTVALAVLGAVTAAGVGNASGGDVLDSSTTSVGVNLPGGDNLPPIGSLPECSNLKDDDGDGQTDLADPGCSGPLDNDEYNPPPPPEGGGSGGGTTGGGSFGGSGPGGAAGTGGTVTGGSTRQGGAGGAQGGSAGSNNNQREPMTPPPPRKPNGQPTKSNP